MFGGSLASVIFVIFVVQGRSLGLIKGEEWALKILVRKRVSVCLSGFGIYLTYSLWMYEIVPHLRAM